MLVLDSRHASRHGFVDLVVIINRKDFVPCVKFIQVFDLPRFEQEASQSRQTSPLTIFRLRWDRSSICTCFTHGTTASPLLSIIMTKSTAQCLEACPLSSTSISGHSWEQAGKHYSTTTTGADVNSPPKLLHISIALAPQVSSAWKIPLIYTQLALSAYLYDLLTFNLSQAP